CGDFLSETNNGEGSSKPPFSTDPGSQLFMVEAVSMRARRLSSDFAAERRVGRSRYASWRGIGRDARPCRRHRTIPGRCKGESQGTKRAFWSGIPAMDAEPI